MLKNQLVEPESSIAGGLGSYGSALDVLGLRHLQRAGWLREDSAENSHLPHRRRERQQQSFKSQASAPRYLTTARRQRQDFYT